MIQVVDGQPEGDGLLAEALVADLAKQAVSTEVEAATAFGDRQDAGAEQVAAFGWGEEAGFAPDDVGSERTLCGIVREIKPRGTHEAPKHGFDLEQFLADTAGPVPLMAGMTLLQGFLEVFSGVA